MQREQAPADGAIFVPAENKPDAKIAGRF